MSFSRSQIDGTILGHLFAYWDSRRQGVRIPKRRDIDPIHIPRLLPHIYLVDVERQDGLRFRIRLAGTYLETAFRQFGAGRYVEEIKLNGETDEILERYRRCAEAAEPIYSRHVFVNEDQRKFDYGRLLLPLLVENEDRVDMIFGGIAFEAPLQTPDFGLGSGRPPGWRLAAALNI